MEILVRRQTNWNQIKAITIDSLLAKTELRHIPDVAEQSKAETHQNNSDFFSESEDQDRGLFEELLGRN